jgi:hypothetical protein
MKVISSKQDIEKFLPAKWASSFSSRRTAIEIYLSTGGIIKIGEVKGEWPRLLYPTVDKLNSEIKSTELELSRIERQLKQIRSKLNDLNETLPKKLKVLFSPLYWKHRMKLLTDKEYKEVYDLVKPPMHLIHDPEWKKRMDIFLKSDDYRMRLKEARLSEIGKRRDVMEKEVERRAEFSRSVVEHLLDKLETKRKALNDKLFALKELKKWAEKS